MVGIPNPYEQTKNDDDEECEYSVIVYRKNDYYLDPDNKVFKKGDFVTFEPGSTHSSFTKDGCLILVFMRGINKALHKSIK